MTYASRLVTALIGAMALLAGLVFATSSSAASQWTTPADLSAGSANLPFPEVVTSSDGQRAVAMWVYSANPDEDYRLQVRTSDDGGRAWGAVQELTLVNSNSISTPAIAMSDDGMKVVIVYARYNGSDSVVYVVRSSDAGKSWTAPQVISTSGNNNTFTDVVLSADGSRITVVWMRFDDFAVQSRSSSNFGQTWGAQVEVAPAHAFAHSTNISGSDDGQTLNVLWAANDGGAIYTIRHSVSTDGGQTWSSEQVLSEPTKTSSNPESVTSADGSRATAAWARTEDFGSVIVASSSTDSGATWSAPTDLTPTSAYAGPFFIAGSSDGQRVILSWDYFDGSTTSVQTSRSANGGSTWSTPQQIADAGSYGGTILLSANGAKAAVVMQEGQFDRAAGLGKIFLRTSSDQGATWQPPVTLTSGVDAVVPVLAGSADLNALTAAWTVMGDKFSVQSTSMFQVQPQPTPTPTPTPTPDKLQQKPTKRAKLPKRLVKRGKTVLAPSKPLTNAGQRLKTRVRCIAARPAASGEVRFCRVRRYANGKVVVRTYGAPLPKVIVIQTAPGTDTYERYRNRTVYKKGRR